MLRSLMQRALTDREELREYLNPVYDLSDFNKDYISVSKSKRSDGI